MLGNIKEQKEYDFGKYSNDLDEEKIELLETKSDFEKKGGRGGKTKQIPEYLTNYLNDKDLKIKNELIIVDGDISKIDAKKIKEKLNNGANITVGATRFDLFSDQDLNGDGLLNDLVRDDVGGHGMTITDVLDDNNFVVSSWGKRYIFNISGKYITTEDGTVIKTNSQTPINELIIYEKDNWVFFISILHCLSKMTIFFNKNIL